MHQPEHGTNALEKASLLLGVLLAVLVVEGRVERRLASASAPKVARPRVDLNLLLGDCVRMDGVKNVYGAFAWFCRRWQWREEDVFPSRTRH